MSLAARFNAREARKNAPASLARRLSVSSRSSGSHLSSRKKMLRHRSRDAGTIPRYRGVNPTAKFRPSLRDEEDAPPVQRSG
jgi:hypothetical protein